MPQAFDNCRKNGGKVRTVKLTGGKYMHVCYLNGKQYKGEVKMKQDVGSGESSVAAAIKQKMEKK